MRLKSIALLSIILIFVVGCSKTENHIETMSDDPYENVQINLFKGEDDDFEAIYIECQSEYDSKDPKVNSGRFYLFNKSNNSFENLEYFLEGSHGDVEEKLSHKLLSKGDVHIAYYLRLNAPGFKVDSLKLTINKDRKIELKLIKE